MTSHGYKRNEKNRLEKHIDGRTELSRFNLVLD